MIDTTQTMTDALNLDRLARRTCRKLAGRSLLSQGRRSAATLGCIRTSWL